MISRFIWSMNEGEPAAQAKASRSRLAVWLFGAGVLSAAAALLLLVGPRIAPSGDPPSPRSLAAASELAPLPLALSVDAANGIHRELDSVGTLIDGDQLRLVLTGLPTDHLALVATLDPRRELRILWPDRGDARCPLGCSHFTIARPARDLPPGPVLILALLGQAPLDESALRAALQRAPQGPLQSVRLPAIPGARAGAAQLVIHAGP